MQKMNGKRQAQWRRDQVLQLTSKGHTLSEISDILQVSISTISRDLSSIREEAKIHVRKYIDETLPEEYEKCLVGLTAILREAWNTSQQTRDNREKLQSLSLAKECYSMKLDLLTNATVVEDVIRFSKSQNRETLSGEAIDKSCRNCKPNNRRDQLEEEQREGRGEIATTTNRVF